MEFAAMIKVFNAREFLSTGNEMFLKDALEIKESILDHYQIPIMTDRSLLGPCLKTFKGINREVFQMAEIQEVKRMTTFEAFVNDAEEITSDGKIVKKVLKPGGGRRPITGAPVWIHYVSFVEGDGEEIDSSLKQKLPYAFILGNAGLDCWNYAVERMEMGEIALVISHADYAYKQYGSPPLIPPNAKMLFFIELLDVPASHKMPILSLSVQEIQSLPWDDLINEVERLWSITNYVIWTDLNLAKQCTLRALNLLSDFSSGERGRDGKVGEALGKGFAHLAQCYLNAYEPERVCALTELVLDLNLSENADLLYSLSKAFVMLEKLDEALIALQAAIAIEEKPSKAEEIMDEVYVILMREEDRILEECMTCFTQIIQDLTPPPSEGSNPGGWLPRLIQVGSTLESSVRSYLEYLSFL